MPNVTGRVSIKVDGRLYQSKEGATLKYVDADGVESREMVITDQGPLGTRDKSGAPTVEATFPHTADLSLAALMAIKNATLTYTTDSGISFILYQATCLGAVSMSGGEVSTSFGAVRCEEA
jgi:hypothetical protein